HLAHDGPGHRHRVVVAVQRQHVPPEEDLAVEVLLKRLHDRVARARKLRGDLVRELDLDPQGVSISFTAALTRFPSARPFTCGITRPMTLPISCGEDAPDSATTLPTISLSSSSESCSGRYDEITSASRSSASAASVRPPSRYASAASRRRLRSRWSTSTGSPPLSFSAFCNASAIRRSACTRSRSPAFSSVFTSSCTCSSSDIRVQV